jgi:CubicO group peptidase (beta-lactamase class C family)
MKFFTRKRVWIGIAVLILALVVYAGYAKREYIQQFPIGCGAKAQLLCSGIFVSGRDEASVLNEDVAFHPLFKMLKPKLDYKEKSVTVSLLGLGLFKKKAIYHDQLGAILIQNVSQDTILGWKVSIPAPEPANPETIPWPTGDLLSGDPLPANVDQAKLKAALDKVFAEPDPKHLKRTRAALVVYDGRILAERYAPGIHKDTRLISWSMAKSITNALVGILVRQGRLNIKDPAPVPEWRSPDDPRHAITIDQLLRMSSGLEWYEAYAEHPVSDVNLMLFTKPDMAAFAAAKPLAAPPNTKWEYSTGTTMIINRIIRQAISNQEEYWAFPRRELFNKIGMRSAVIESDASGTFTAGSGIYVCARDYARFGLLYLQDGVWQGERILPVGWVLYTTTATLTDNADDYGAQFWLNKGDPNNPAKRSYPTLPPDMFLAEGYQGQMIAMIPSRKLVVVRLGMTFDDRWGKAEFLEEVLRAISEP